MGRIRVNFAVAVNEQGFVERRDADWRRLAELNNVVDARGLKKLSDEEFIEYFKLYRKVSNDLALVRTKSRSSSLVAPLNDLVGRVYGVLYRAPRPAVGASIANAVANAAQTFRRRKAFVFTSALIFFGAWFFAYGLIQAKPQARSLFVAPTMEGNFKEWKEGKFQEHGFTESVGANAMYASNNPQAAIFGASIGAGTFGIGSVYVLFTNGALIGALSHDMNSVGKLGFLLASIFPHGVTELSGIIISGSAGLLFASALLNPGRKRRGDALKAVGKDGLTLLATSVILMFMAAPIEAYFSFNPNVPIQAKVAFALISACAWATFWTFYAQEPHEDAVPKRAKGLA
ncbi:stage II sporulation protein M [soil metagenome]